MCRIVTFGVETMSLSLNKPEVVHQTKKYTKFSVRLTVKCQYGCESVLKRLERHQMSKLYQANALG